jgi:hypothetical protein
MDSRSARIGPALWWAIVSLAFLDRVLVLARFGFPFTNSDQVLLWMCGRDYSHGEFHEPCVYGQNYNFPLESLLAAPFLRLGFAAWHVLPIVTTTLAMAPFLALGFYFRRRDLMVACALAAIPILLPPEYDLMTTGPLGLMNGLFAVSFFGFIWGIQREKLRFFLAGAAAGFGLLLNPNCAPVFVALLLAMQLEKGRHWQTWLYPILGAAPFAVLGSLTAIFYAAHPPMHTLKGAMIAFDAEFFLRQLNRLDVHFRWLCPVFWSMGGSALFFIAALIVGLFWKRRFAQALALLAAGGVILYSLGLPKIDDGTDWVAYPYSRMYLGVPLLLGVGIAFCAGLVKKPVKYCLWLLVICLAFMVPKISSLHGAVENQLNTPPGIPQFIRVEDLKKMCGKIDALAQGKVDLVVALPPVNCSYPDAAFYCYAGDVVFPDFPKTLIHGFERRAWRAQIEATNVNNTLLFVGGTKSGWARLAGPDVFDKSDGQTVIHLVRNSAKLPTRELLLKLKPVIGPTIP